MTRILNPRGALISVIALLSLQACGGVNAYRSGEPVALPSGPPQGECEEEDWLELVPTHVSAHEPTGHTSSDGFYTYTYSYTARRNAQGLSVFAPETDKPIPIADLLPKLNDPKLTKRHEDRVKPVQRMESLSNTLSAISYVTMGVGLVAVLGGLVAFVDTSNEQRSNAGLAVMMGGTGAVVFGSVLFAVGYGWLRPEPSELTLLRTRELTFLPQENNMDRITQGVDQLNQQTRQRCKDR